jgi:hypothetical protein
VSQANKQNKKTSVKGKKIKNLNDKKKHKKMTKACLDGSGLYSL